MLGLIVETIVQKRGDSIVSAVLKGAGDSVVAVTESIQRNVGVGAFGFAFNGNDESVVDESIGDG